MYSLTYCENTCLTAGVFGFIRHQSPCVQTEGAAVKDIKTQVDFIITVTKQNTKFIKDREHRSTC